MKIKQLLILMLLLAGLISCDNINTSDALSSEEMVIHIQPFNGIEQNNVTYVYDGLRKIYPKILINKTIALPGSAYYKPRNRYKADSLIKFLRTITPKGQVTIGLTNKDISTTKGEIADYGVMGLGYQPGSSCVVSTFRLSKNKLPEQYFKVSIHELGHTQGLPHCPVKTCYMRDAEGKNHTDEETDFCTTCKSHLVARGWIFNEHL